MRVVVIARGLLAAMLAFAAVVLWAQTGAWQLATTVAGASLVALVWMMWGAAREKRVVVVGTGDLRTVEDALEEAGYGTRMCLGPEARTCPVFEGQPCPIHGHLVAAIIYRSPDFAGPEAPCRRALHVPTITVDRESDEQPVIVAAGARLGGRRGPREAVELVEGLAGIAS